MTQEAAETIFENSALVVTKQALENLHSHLEALSQANRPLKIGSETDDEFGVTYAIELEDGGSRKIRTLADLLKYGNRGKRRIARLSVRTTPQYRGNSVSIKIGDSIPIAQIHISGDEATAWKARQFCEDFLAVSRSPFNWLYSSSGKWVLFIFWVSLAVAAFLVSYGITLFTWKSVLPWIALMLLNMALPWIVQPIRDKFFPKVIFAIGLEADRYESTKSLHTWAVRAAIAATVSISLGVFWKWAESS